MTIRDYSNFLAEFPTLAERWNELESLGLSQRTKNWIENALTNAVGKDSNSESEYDAELERAVRNELRNIKKIVHLAWPNFDPDMPGYIVMWANEKGREKGRKGRISLKSGRAFRKMFPCLTDAEIERLVDEFRNRFAVRTLTVHQTQERQMFRDVFSGNMAEFENPYTTSSRKFLGNSCMRYSFEEIDAHPAEAYASGDFTLFFARDERGKIAGRCVVYTEPEKWQAAPIYGVSEQAISKIEQAILNANSDVQFECYKSDWDGARMLFIENNCGAAILPYIDTDIRKLTKTDDGFLVFDTGGEYHADTISGLVYPSRLRCFHCGDSVSDAYAVTHHGDRWCEDCFHENHFHCDCCNEYEPVEQMNTVFSESQHIHANENYYCDHCANCSATEVLHIRGRTVLWAEDEVITTADGDNVSPRLAAEEYFVSDWDGEYYHIDDTAEVGDGSYVSVTEIQIAINNGEKWVQDSWSVWNLEEQEENNERETETEGQASA